MSFTQDELDAIARLPNYEDVTYHPVNAPQGLGGEGYKTNIPASYDDIGAVAGAIARETGNIESNVTAAAQSAAAANQSRDQAAASEAVCLAIATDDFAVVPATDVTLTGSNYNLDFSPDRTVQDGFAAIVSMSASNPEDPTMSVDGTAQYPLVDGRAQDDAGNYRRLKTGEIRANDNIFVVFDDRVNQYRITDLPIRHLIDDLDLNHHAIENAYRPFENVAAAKTFTQDDCGTTHLLTGSTDRTWVLEDEATQAIVQGSEIEIFNDSSAGLTLTAAQGVTVNGVVNNAGSIQILLLANEGGVLKKTDADRWIWNGDRKFEWSAV